MEVSPFSRIITWLTGLRLSIPISFAYLTTFVTLISAALIVQISFSVTRKHYHIQNQADEPDKQFFTLSQLRAPPTFA